MKLVTDTSVSQEVLVDQFMDIAKTQGREVAEQGVKRLAAAICQVMQNFQTNDHRDKWVSERLQEQAGLMSPAMFLACEANIRGVLNTQFDESIKITEEYKPAYEPIRADWFPVKGYESLYEINAEGNVHDLDTNKPVQAFRQGPFGDEYVPLLKDGFFVEHMVQVLLQESVDPSLIVAKPKEAVTEPAPVKIPMKTQYTQLAFMVDSSDTASSLISKYRKKFGGKGSEISCKAVVVINLRNLVNKGYTTVKQVENLIADDKRNTGHKSLKLYGNPVRIIMSGFQDSRKFW